MAGRQLSSLQNATSVENGDKFLVQQGLASKQVDLGVIKLAIQDHSALYNRNPANGSAHNADDVAKNGGGTVQDFIDSTQISSGSIAHLSKLIANFGIAAWAQAANYKNFIIDVDVVKTGRYDIPTGQRITFAADVTQADDGFSFVGSSSLWSIDGAGTIKRSGGLPASYVADSIGLLTTSTAFKWSISGAIRIEHFAGRGFISNGSDVVTGEVSRSKISGLTCHQNAINYEFLAGFAAEYITLSNSFATDATLTGVIEESGNVNWVGGAITGNQAGIHLRNPSSGANPHHGMFVGVHINHNIEFQLWAEKTANGYDFSACHFYDNGDNTTGRIKLDNCRGINITGGTLGCYIEYVNDGHAHVGYNYIANNKCEPTLAAIVTGPGFDRTKLIVKNNFAPFSAGVVGSGRWFYDDLSDVYAQTKPSAALSVTTTTFSVGVFDTEQFDNRNALAASFVTPFQGVYEWDISLIMSTTSLGSGQYVSIQKDNGGNGVFVEVGAIPVTYVTSTLSMAVGKFSLPVASGDQLSAFLTSPSGLFGTQITPLSKVSYRLI